MSRFPALKKVVTFLLVAVVVIVLAFSALSFGSQMNEAQKKVNDLQNQLAHYENVTDSLQTQASSLEAQIYDLQNPVVNVTFTDISVGPWIFDYPYHKDINVTFQNVGTTTVGGVTLAFKVEGNTTNIGDFLIYVSPHQLGVLQVKELQTLKVRLATGWEDRKQALSECNFTITLMLDKLALDRQTVMIGP